MKRILIASLTILLIASAIEAYALSAAIQAVCGANSTVSCTTSNDSELVAIGGSDNNASTYTYYVAQPFTVTANTSITEYSVYLKDTAAAGNTTTCGIYTNSSGVPGTLVEGTEDTDSFSTSSWTYVTFDVTGDSVLLSGTVYYVKCHSVSTGMIWGRNSTATGSNACLDTDDASWSCAQNYTHGLKINGCAP